MRAHTFLQLSFSIHPLSLSCSLVDLLISLNQADPLQKETQKLKPFQLRVCAGNTAFSITGSALISVTLVTMYMTPMFSGGQKMALPFFFIMLLLPHGIFLLEINQDLGSSEEEVEEEEAGRAHKWSII